MGSGLYDGYDQRETFRQAAFYLNRILKGGEPGALPGVQSPMKVVLFINLGTAKALGIAVPLGLMLHADAARCSALDGCGAGAR